MGVSKQEFKQNSQILELILKSMLLSGEKNKVGKGW